MRIGVLGCGPSGLLAAHMIRQAGHSTLILSDKTPSYIAGAQYLHAPVPGIHHPSGPADDFIDVYKKGTREGYATKVYGRPDAPVSWDRYEEHTYPAWNMRSVYERLWEEFEPHIVDLHLDPHIVAQLVSERPYGADAWVSTVPLPALCRRNVNEADDHVFVSQEVHVVQYEDKWPEGQPSFIEYNGEKAPGWYRRSIIFQTEALEWSGQGPKPPIDGVVTISKPVRTTCDCWRGGLLLQGRYGAWHKEFLTNHVMNNVAQYVRRLETTGVTA